MDLKRPGYQRNVWSQFLNVVCCCNFTETKLLGVYSFTGQGVISQKQGLSILWSSRCTNWFHVIL